MKCMCTIVKCKRSLVLMRCPTSGFCRRASLSVRITDKNGDHAEAGKIWENQFFTRKMGPHGPENTQIHQSTCQRPRGTCQNFFSFTNFVAGVTFPKVTLRLPKKVLNQKIWISLAVISYLSAPIFLISLPHHCCTAQQCQAMLGVYWCKKNVIWIKNILLLS